MDQVSDIIALDKESSSNVKEKNYIYEGLKRIFDIIVALIAIVFLIPVAIGIKIATLLSKDKESIFYQQDRIGKDGEVFKLYKFRSMVPNADEILENTLEMDVVAREEYKKNKKLRNDPRITKVGRFIRKTSIDELPQVINILRGDMTFIGNRPYMPKEKEDMGEFYDDIVKTKPGLTGYWQVNGRSNTTFRKRLELESYYSNKRSMSMDIKIFFKTFSAVLLSKGSR